MFRFTIRELLLLTVIAALGVGWSVDHFRNRSYRYWQTAATDLANTLRKEGYVVEFNETEGTFAVGLDQHDR